MNKLFINIFCISVVVSVLVMFFKLLSPILLKRYGARFRQIIWVILALRLVVPFIYSIPHYETIIRPWVTSEESNYVEEEINDNVYLNNSNVKDHDSDKDTSIQNENNRIERSGRFIDNLINMYCNNADIIGKLYVIGVALFLCFHLLSFYVMRYRIESTAREVFCEVNKSILAIIANELKIKKIPKVFFSKKAKGPMVAGVLNPVIYIPDMEYTDRELEFIFRHELLHIQHKDLWIKKLYFLANALHWFNPICYLMTAEAGKDMELYCDESAVKHYSLDDRKNYNSILLKFIEAFNSFNSGDKYFTTSYRGNVKDMKIRFSNNTDMSRKRFGFVALAISFIICLILSETFVTDVRANAKIKEAVGYRLQIVYYFDEDNNQTTEIKREAFNEAPQIQIYCDYEKIDDYGCIMEHSTDSDKMYMDDIYFFNTQVEKREENPLFDVSFQNVPSGNFNIIFPEGWVPDEVSVEDFVLNDKGYPKYMSQDGMIEYRQASISKEYDSVKFGLYNHHSIINYEDDTYSSEIGKTFYRGYNIKCSWKTVAGTKNVTYMFVIRTKILKYDYMSFSEGWK